MRRTSLWILGLAGCFSAWAAQPDVGFAVTRVTEQVVPQERQFEAVIEAVKKSTVSAQTSGRVVELNFDVDDYVEKGEVILRFRDKEQRARVEAAQAARREAQARLAQARKDYNRVREIYERNLVAKSKLDAAAAELQAAEARLEATRARLQEAREQLENTVVRAPYSGIVVERHVEIGEAANVGTPLMTGLSLDHVRALVRLPQGFVDDVRGNGAAYVVLPDGRRVKAEQPVVFPYADPASHTFKVRVDLPAGTAGLYPGMLVKVAFEVGRTRRLLIPRKAVVHRSEVTAVYVVADDGTVSLRQIRVGRTHGEQLEVLAGLSDGETVALDPIRAGVLLKEQRAGQGV